MERHEVSNYLNRVYTLLIDSIYHRVTTTYSYHFKIESQQKEEIYKNYKQKELATLFEQNILSYFLQERTILRVVPTIKKITNKP